MNKPDNKTACASTAALMSLAALFFSLTPIRGSAQSAAPLSPTGAPGPTAIAELTPHSRPWTNSLARIVEVASGMHFWNGQALVPSEPALRLTTQGDAFVAQRVQHKIRLASDIT